MSDVLREMKERLLALQNGKDAALAQANAFNGAMEELTEWIRRLEAEFKKQPKDEPAPES